MFHFKSGMETIKRHKGILAISALFIIVLGVYWYWSELKRGEVYFAIHVECGKQATEYAQEQTDYSDDFSRDLEVYGMHYDNYYLDCLARNGLQEDARKLLQQKQER